MEAPKSYESNGYQYDKVFSNSTRRLEEVNEMIKAAATMGLWTMVVPGTSGGYVGDPTHFLYFYNRSRIEVPK